MHEDVTVVIACHEYGRFLNACVESALSQEGGAPAVVVVDDGSKGADTVTALDELPTEVHVIRQANTGVCGARNAGLGAVRTSYAIVVDADDRLEPTALNVLRAPLDADPALGFAYGRMRFFGDWDGVLRMPPYDPYALLFRHTIGLSALMRMDVVRDTGGFDPSFEHLEDWELWVHALARGWRGVQVDAVTLAYRRHGAAKHGIDRRGYHAMYRALRRKHVELYAARSRLARESALGPAGRLAHRLYWGPRPIPAAIEQRLYRLRWGS